MIIVTDLEGVLIPEIWVAVARTTGIAELAATTHDEPDFGRLMDRRIELLAEHDLRLPLLQQIAADVTPYPGAAELLAWARTKGQVMIASDTFHELSETIVQRMGGYNLFANRFHADAEGRILGYRLRIRGRKDNVVRSLKDIGFHIVAIGDGFNDELMLHIADDAVLYRAPEELARRVPSGHRAKDFDDVRRIVSAAHERLGIAPQPLPI
ncbi:MAG: bifunctional phosphoserine phosphatase/homoserine phosphotransferase ThrH [Candidatus Eiseniibacteriota bacterium]